MGDELRADARDVLRHWHGLTDREAESAAGCLAGKAAWVAAAFLAEHPADDDEPVGDGLPGFKAGSVSGRLYHESGRLEIDPGGAAIIVDAIGQRVTCVAVVRTRGDVRRLCRCLGIPLAHG